MSAATMTSFLAVLMLLITAVVGVSAWREHRHNRQVLAAQNRLPAHPLDRHVTAILHLKDGEIVSVESPAALLAPVATRSPWSTHRRSLVSVGVLVLFVLALFLQVGLAGGTLAKLSQGTMDSQYSNSMSYSPSGHALEQPANTNPGNTDTNQPVFLNASARVVRLDSADSSQYSTLYERQTWVYSSCSGFAMVMVMDAYGRHLIASDVLQEELNLGVWSVDQGLLREEGIAMTANYFGFNTSWGHTMTLQQVIDTANSGQPVIVSVRHPTYYPYGHIFVVRGGDAQNVYIADSAPTNFHSMSRAMFLGMWQTFSAVLTPR